MTDSRKDNNNEEKLYSIGEVSRICNVSKKALRFYDKIGIIAPDYVSETTGYRYYNEKTLLLVPVIKYYKQMGFKLEEMKAFLDAGSYDVHEQGFRNKIDDLKQLREEIYVSYTSVSDWYNLIQEAKSVIENRADEVSVKFKDGKTAPCMEFEFDNNYMDSIINIEWTNHLEEIGQSITGSVNIVFPDYREKLEGKSTKAYIFQTGVRDIRDQQNITIWGNMQVAAYHIGSHETIGDTYEKIFRWAEEHGYKLGTQSVERYVTDYWTVRNPAGFVTEILIDIEK